jgi:hypothetical protein
VHVVAMPERTTEEQSRAAAVDAMGGGFGHRPAPKPLARVVLSGADGRGWALAPGSMTLSTAKPESGQSS